MKVRIKMVLIAGLAVLAACGPGNGDERATRLHEEPQTMQIVAREMSFGPDNLHLRSGQQVSLRFINKGRVLHDWNLVGVNSTAQGHTHSAPPAGHDNHRHAVGPDQLHVMALPDDESNIDFVAPAPGEYEYFCSVPGHREAGMVGRIFVH